MKNIATTPFKDGGCKDGYDKDTFPSNYISLAATCSKLRVQWWTALILLVVSLGLFSAAVMYSYRLIRYLAAKKRKEEEEKEAAETQKQIDVAV